MTMRNIKLLLEYDGGKYNGWQRLGGHTSSNTIQGKLEGVLQKMTGEEIQVIGSGRTDAGVHALSQTANFHTTSPLSCEEIQACLMTYLPKDICVFSVSDVPERFHSRLSASAKTYLYRVNLPDSHDVFARKYTWQYPESLDASRIQKAANLLVGVHDFKGYSSVKKTKKSTVREIYGISVTELQKNGRKKEIQIRFRGNGFLYNMVRILTGTLLEAGAGTRPVSSVTLPFETQNREDAGITAPAQGLFLESVEYPPSVFRF